VTEKNWVNPTTTKNIIQVEGKLLEGKLRFWVFHFHLALSLFFSHRFYTIFILFNFYYLGA